MKTLKDFIQEALNDWKDEEKLDKAIASTMEIFIDELEGKAEKFFTDITDSNYDRFVSRMCTREGWKKHLLLNKLDLHDKINAEFERVYNS